MAWLAFVLSLAGTVCLYLAAPRQSWLAQPWPARMRWPGLLLLVLAQAAWLQALRPLAGLFMGITLLMLLAVALPYLGALRRLLGARHG